MTHTPGQWSIEGDKIVNENYLMICKMPYPVYPKETGPDEISDNARLITAAPELLETLKKLLFYFDNFGKGLGEKEYPVNMILESIAKAEGSL